MKETKICMYPKCDHPVVVRGLCNHHYRSARYLVISGVTTWKALEQAGKCKPARRTGRPTESSWFLEKN